MRVTNHPAGSPVAADTATILANVVWIVDRLDRAGLRELNAVPVLELAKHIAVGRRAIARPAATA